MHTTGGEIEIIRSDSSSAPIASVERVVSIDVMRGVALVGVLLVNLISGFHQPLSAAILGSHEPIGWGGAWVVKVVRILIEFKALTLFSFLFGAGVAIQAGRSYCQRRTWFLVRRFGALLAFGLIHMIFVWNGDILCLYGICGLLLIPLLWLPDYALTALGITLIVWPNLAPFPVDFPTTSTLKALTGEALNAYRYASWPDLFVFRLQEIRLLILPLLCLTMPRTLGLMSLGMVAWRKGWLVNGPPIWRCAAIIGLVVGVGGQWLRIEEAGNIGLALVYAAIVLLWNPHASWIAAAGQMALTNYLAQSIIFGFVFYGYGLGWFGRMEVVPASCLGIAIYGTQAAVSRWWLNRFCFGPLEWLWRSVSYLRWQPCKRLPSQGKR